MHKLFPKFLKLAPARTLPSFAGLVERLLTEAKTDSTVGLDEQTRAMISNFPKDVREQTYELLGQALPLLKTNIDAYLKEVNDSVETQILNVQCAATGLAAEFKEQFKGIFTNPRGPIAQFRIDEANALKSLKRSTTPDRYADAYRDLYHESAVMFCQMHISGASPTAWTSASRSIDPDLMRRNVLLFSAGHDVGCDIFD
jgi:hypothetical protein